MTSKLVAAVTAIGLGVTMASTGTLAHGGHGGGHDGGGHGGGGGHPGGSAHFSGGFGGFGVAAGGVNRGVGRLNHRFFAARGFNGSALPGPHYCYTTFPHYDGYNRCYDYVW